MVLTCSTSAVPTRQPQPHSHSHIATATATATTATQPHTCAGTPTNSSQHTCRWAVNMATACAIMPGSSGAASHFAAWTTDENTLHRLLATRGWLPNFAAAWVHSGHAISISVTTGWTPSASPPAPPLPPAVVVAEPRAAVPRLVTSVKRMTPARTSSSSATRAVDASSTATPAPTEAAMLATTGPTSCCNDAWGTHSHTYTHTHTAEQPNSHSHTHTRHT